MQGGLGRLMGGYFVDTYNTQKTVHPVNFHRNKKSGFMFFNQNDIEKTIALRTPPNWKRISSSPFFRKIKQKQTWKFSDKRAVIIVFRAKSHD